MTSEIKTRLAQIRTGEIPQGYKKTKLGIIPQEWEVMSLKSRFDRLTRKNSEGNTNVMTISAQYGLINQEEFFKKEIASEDKSNYYLLHNGEFAYNKSYSSGYPFGAIKRLSLYDKGIVSPLYICFSANNNNSCPEFYQHYFESGKLNSEIQAIAQEGARNHGLLNISVEDFFYTIIIVPPLEEQKKIANILSAQDRIIELCERKLEQLKRMKKYYLQNMFPKGGEEYPEIRFKGFTDPWEQRKLGEVLTSYTDPVEIPHTGYERLGIRSHAKGTFHSYVPAGHELQTAQMHKVAADKFIVNITFGWEHAVAVTDENDAGKLVSHRFPQFSLSKELDPKFLKFIILDENFRHHLWLASPGGAGRNRVLNLNEMLQYEIRIPGVSEQRQIANALINLDHLITIHQRKCEEEKKKKKALQQLLLTGIIRV